ncbi:short chain dehydrogenase [Streptomyces sp. SolWspMP-sol7th]|nr:short chain dehydrogenase [Streptomyces sp. SolWspMP-sol7th]
MSTEAGQLAGKTALVTGGSTGIGFASAKRLAEEGAHVFVTGRREAALDEAVAAIGPARATAVVGDVSRAADVDRLYAAVRARGRGLDVVFANAGTGAFATLEETTGEHRRRDLRHQRARHRAHRAGRAPAPQRRGLG